MRTHRCTQLSLYCPGGEGSVCSSSSGNGDKQRRAERCSSCFCRGCWNTRNSSSPVETPGMLSDGVILLHDNARPHTANLVRVKVKRLSWETLQHPPYRPDLSPCDFHIFGDLKKDIRGRRFHSDEEVQEWVRLWIHQRSTSFYKTGVDYLVSQWDKCINTFFIHCYLETLQRVGHTATRVFGCIPEGCVFLLLCVVNVQLLNSLN